VPVLSLGPARTGWISREPSRSHARSPRGTENHMSFNVNKIQRFRGEDTGAGEGNRTLVCSLANSWSSLSCASPVPTDNRFRSATPIRFSLALKLELPTKQDDDRTATSGGGAKKVCQIPNYAL
jgi:hypothetical protein